MDQSGYSWVRGEDDGDEGRSSVSSMRKAAIVEKVVVFLTKTLKIQWENDFITEKG